MRGLHIINNLFHTALRNRLFYVGFFILSISLSLLAPLAPTASATSNDIVGGGVWNRDLAGKCHGDVKTIMDHYRIDCNLAGVVEGRVCRDGNVYVGDRIVARDSRSIGRNPIQGNRPISIGGQTYYETHNSQALLSQCLDSWVKLDGNGSFVYAIIKACGNPIWTPAPVVVSPPQTPEKKFIWVCELATKQARYVSEESAKDTSKYSLDFAKCKEEPKPPIKVCRLSDKTIIEIKESEYSSSLHSKTLSDCDKQEEPKKITVCELATKKQIEIKESDFDASKHATKCPEEPSNPKGEELPTTGIMDGLMGGGIGIGSLIVAGSAYLTSRRDWLNTLLGR